MRRRQIHQLDLVRRLDHRVRHGLPHGHAGDLADGVGPAFEMLDVEGGEDVDPGGQQFLYVLPAFDVARAGDVGMREFIYDDQPRTAFQHRLQIQLPQLGAVVRDDLARNDWQPFEQALSFLATVGFDQSHHKVHPPGVGLACGLQHRVGFAYAGRHAKEDL